MAQINRALEKTPMPSLTPEERNTHFQEVTLGYTQEDALNEALRCLNCKNRPCVAGCPVNIHIPEFIEKIKEGELEEAYQIIAKDSCLPAVCGRVCPQETQCERKCVRGIKGEPVGIGRLERFVADWHNARCQEEINPEPSNGHKVAVIGAGPSGLTFAREMAIKGYQVTIFEALHEAGGVLMYGIPEFRLPKKIVETEVGNLKKMGVEIQTNVVIGKTLTIEDLKEEGYEGVYIASGAGLPRFMNIPGENWKGVFSANEFLSRVNLMKAYRPDSQTPLFRASHTVVVGGGNVAMDAARCAKRLGSEVTVVYRRSEKELPARQEEVEHAKEEGIIFRFLTNPVEILADENGWAKTLVCQEMQLSEPDASGRSRPVPVEGSRIELPVESVIMAIGTSPNPLIRMTTPGLETNRHGCIVADEATGETSLPAIYAGGDAVTGAATVISAMGAGKAAAKAMDEAFQKWEK